MKITTTMNDFSDWSEITWNEFTDMISNPFNSPSSIREREKNGEDTITACFTLEFLDVHLFRGRSECASGLLEQIKKWEKE